MRHARLSWIALIVASVLFVSCEKDKGETNQEEVITTMVLRFTPQGGGAVSVFEFVDPDGPGGGAPSIDEIQLAANTQYNVRIELLNNTVNPPENITEEVEAESDAHRFYILPSGSSGITVSNLNADDNGVSLGTSSTWTTGTAATGTVRVVLRHYPADPPNKLETDPVDSPKSGTDIEVTFDTAVN